MESKYLASGFDTIRFSHYIIRSFRIRSELMASWYSNTSYPRLQTSKDLSSHQTCKLPPFARLDSTLLGRRQTAHHTTRMKIQIYKPRIDRTERIYVECYTVWLVCWCCVWNPFAHEFWLLCLPSPSLTSLPFWYKPLYSNLTVLQYYF
jgi:hypothetical protein